MPSPARAKIRSQNSRRATGSMPAVGSSRKRSSGSCRSAGGQGETLLPAAGEVAGAAGGAGRSSPARCPGRRSTRAPAAQAVEASDEGEVLAGR